MSNTELTLTKVNQMPDRARSDYIRLEFTNTEFDKVLSLRAKSIVFHEDHFNKVSISFDEYEDFATMKALCSILNDMTETIISLHFYNKTLDKLLYTYKLGSHTCTCIMPMNCNQRTSCDPSLLTINAVFEPTVE